MSARDVDAVIAAAQARLRVAADLIERGRDELRAVLAALEEHPDFKRTARTGRQYPRTSALTLAWWLHNGTHSTLFDIQLDEAPEMLWADTDPELLAASMRQFIEEEAADEARIARKRVQSGRKRPAAVQATA